MGSFKIKAQSTLLGRGYHLGKPQAAKDIWLPDADRKGHMFCFGSTRIGKTKLIELMIEQDIRKGYSVTLFDPKGDIDLLSSIVQVAFEENRQHELCLITPIFPEYSASIDPLAYYFMPEELVSHVVSGIKAKEEFFINIAYETTLIIVLTLLLFAKARNEKCRINLNDIKERASHACLEDLKAELESIPESPEKADILASLTQILDSPKDYFAKISSSLRTTLTSLSTGNVGKIIGRAQSNQFIKRLEQNKRVILVVQTGSLLTRKTAHIVARVLISMIQSFIGRRYASGRTVSPPLAIYLDEASNLMYIGIDELFNKAGGAGAWVHAFTQSISDLEAEIGRPFAKKILDNTNTKVFMRVNDPTTAEYVADYSGEQKRFSPLLSLGGAITIREVKENAILPEHILNLQEREFFLFSYQGQYRGKTLFVKPPYFQIEYPHVNVF
ncbi:MAG: TraM recognition domain-containing protein [Deltaproteobacteria bacterium]|nr:TraM recognition domain-containing protein [Deltaproteobacteria bacterium]MBW2330188.1 TraM recognition domain-containing protein [Deltaproteobacteria bacterium]